MPPLFQRYFPVLIFISLVLILFLTHGILNSIFVVENSTVLVLMSDKIEKTNKSDKHKNQDSIQSAQKKLEEAKEKYKSLSSKVNKTKADKENEERLLREIKHWKKKELFVAEVKSSLEEDLLVPLDNVKNIWGFGVLSRVYGLIDLIKTETENKKSGNSLFTFVLDFLGGTYISQIKAKTLDSAKLEWANKLTVQEISGWRNSSKVKFVNQIDTFSLKTNPSSINVWNFDFHSGKNKGTVYCVKTEAT